MLFLLKRLVTSSCLAAARQSTPALFFISASTKPLFQSRGGDTSSTVLQQNINKKKRAGGTRKITIIVTPTEFMKNCILRREFPRNVKAFTVKQRQRTFECVGCKRAIWEKKEKLSVAPMIVL